MNGTSFHSIPSIDDFISLSCRGFIHKLRRIHSYRHYLGLFAPKFTSKGKQNTSRKISAAKSKLLGTKITGLCYIHQMQF
jgi:hypothetical protein